MNVSLRADLPEIQLKVWGGARVSETAGTLKTAAGCPLM